MTTYVELFSGGGGLSLGLDRAGWQCQAHVEIDREARALLRRHWPDAKLFGDVSILDGTQFQGISLLSGGSPCQGMAKQGLLGGLVGDPRSALFFHQARLWRESQAPYFLWENVHGALTSNHGRDFGRVLSTLVGAPVSVPRNPARARVRWPSAGLVHGPAGVAVWRVLNLRHWLPQARRRVFIVAARADVRSPAPVLLDCADLCAGAGEGGDGGTANHGAPPRRSTTGADDVEVMTLNARDAKGAGNYRDGALQGCLVADGWYRRLVNVERERLMGWPDGWTEWGFDEAEQRVVLSGTARERITGNGVGSPITQWIGGRLLRLIEGTL